MRITILGSGTSHGVPMIGCSCPVCTSDHPKNKRLRTSVWIEQGNTSLIIDTSTDFRIQALRAGITSLDAVVLTHSHADHVHGLDDLRPLTFRKTLPVFAAADTIRDIENRFDYIFRNTQRGGGKPNITLELIDESPFTVGDITVIPVPVLHGSLEVLAFRIGGFAYATDVSEIPPASMKLLEKAEVVVIDGLRYRPHATHFSVDQAVTILQELKPQKGYITHICHDLDHEDLTAYLPERIEPAWDGLIITL